MIPGTDACCILLYGDIGEYDDNVRSGDIARELLEAEALTGKVDVRINSNGGEVYSGIAIFNALKNSKADITIYVDGIAASMASVIALCGKPVQMSRYARLMLHSVQGGCYGNKDEMKDCIREIEALEDTLCEMYATRMGKDKEEIRAMYFDGKDHWLRADEALALGLIDGIYDADPVPEDSTPEQVFQIFNNRLHKPQNENSMNLDELKRRPRFKNCATDDDFLREIGLLETEAGKVPALDAEVTRLKGELKVFQDKADADDAAARKKLLDDAEQAAALQIRQNDVAHFACVRKAEKRADALIVRQDFGKSHRNRLLLRAADADIELRLRRSGQCQPDKCHPKG